MSNVTVFLKNRNFNSKIRISKVTDYAALITLPQITTALSYKIPVALIIVSKKGVLVHNSNGGLG